MARARKPRSVLGTLSKRAARLRSDASKTLVRLRKRGEKAVESGWEAALDSVPPPARRAVRDARGTLRRLTAELERRRARALKIVEKRGENLVEQFEKRAADVMKPVVHRLNVASKSDIERLSRRIAKLERRRERVVRRAGHAAAA